MKWLKQLLNWLKELLREWLCDESWPTDEDQDTLDEVGLIRR